VISGVATDTKLSDFVPKFWVYHFVDSGIDFTVRTRWSRDLIVAAGVDIFLSVVKLPLNNEEDLRRGMGDLLKANI
jgi:hypothetical protein